MSNVTTALDMTKVDLNVTKIFTETNTFNGTLSEWQSPIFTLTGWDNYYAVGEKLESDWKTAHDGQRPPVDPTVLLCHVHSNFRRKENGIMSLRI
jgi:hypothetical protein